MLKTVFWVLAILLTGVSVLAADQPAENKIVTPYLGLAMPIPDTIPVLTIPAEKSFRLLNKTLTALLILDEKGRVGRIDYDSTMDEYVKPLQKDLKKMTFHFLGGDSPGEPFSVPVGINFSMATDRSKQAQLTFPLGADSTSNPEILGLFFKDNDIEPPTINDFPPIFYRVDPQKEKADYLTVTAHVFLDEQGNLQDITYPIPGQDKMTHAVQMGLVNSRFTPARIKGRAMASDFLVTFRIYDNLKYPFSPQVPPDSLEILPISARYFMKIHFDSGDMSMPPIPRTHGTGFIHSATLIRRLAGTARVAIRIDREGIITGFSISGATAGVEKVARPLIKLLKWYPALDRDGEPIPFAGKILLTFDGSPRVVYNAEWLSP